MTEGAQYKHFSEVLQRIKGQRLLKVSRAILKLASALQPLLGRRVLRVISVGKEIFFVFEAPGRPGQDGQALKIHFGDGPGYQYEAGGTAWGMVRRLPGGRVAETELEFENCIFRLWEDHNFYSHIYEVVDFGYVHAVEARQHRDIATEACAQYQHETVSALKNKDSFKDSYVVDAIMDQTLLPGVGNIIKTEGLFRAGVHPLLRCRNIEVAQLRELVEQLNSFSLGWYRLCKETGEGAPKQNSEAQDKSLEKLCYGRSDCLTCGGEIYCIKLGTRQRITYFCNTCQPPGSGMTKPLRRSHKHEMHFKLPCCRCKKPAKMMHVYRYGADHGRAFLGCSKPAGSRCKFRKWLSEVVTEMPMCRCREPKRMVVRRVMGLVDNGRYFAQCATKDCSHRVWLIPDSDKAEEASADHENDVHSTRRWRSRRAKPVTGSEELVDSREASTSSGVNSKGLFVQRAKTGEFVHGRHGMAQLSGHLLGVPSKTGKQAAPASGNRSGSVTPVTSGAEELLEDDQRPRTPPPDLNVAWSKRWARSLDERPTIRAAPLEDVEPHGDTTSFEESSVLEAVEKIEAMVAAKAASQLKEVLCILPDASPELITELFAEGLTVEQVVDCLYLQSPYGDHDMIYF
eukprot:TRINITY_DN6645_c1_g1_i1.p1 TRINITY_DN6645_c1_g1~~TRINITY_DN6645_c1_g1_i1.p1  ORF type:complete len:628 (-),score=64.25 TRINITY_DN6645_c1_g1_i1:97-1980(-)